MRLYGPSSVSVPGGGVAPFLPRMTRTRLIRLLSGWWLAVRARDLDSHRRATLAGGEGAL
jgi:hypothetical protein